MPLATARAPGHRTSFPHSTSRPRTFRTRPVVSLAVLAAVSITGSRYIRTAPTATAKASMGSIKLVPQKSVFVSEPPPQWFGNPGNERGNPSWTNENWLKSRFHFSFAEYRSSERNNFGVLRVLNDDLVQPARGFGTHPHSNAEICTYVVRGSLTHADSMGTAEMLGRGAVQFMTAGTGVSHSEHNRDPKADLRFIQMWFTPRRAGLKPNYGSFVGDLAGRQDRWQHLAGDAESREGKAAHVQVNTDTNLFVTELSRGKQVQFEAKEGRKAYVVCLEGSAALRGGKDGEVAMEQHDAAHVYGPLSLDVAAGPKGAHVLLVDVAAN